MIFSPFLINETDAGEVFHHGIFLPPETAKIIKYSGILCTLSSRNQPAAAANELFTPMQSIVDFR